jgi:uncharacterized protein YuzE
VGSTLEITYDPKADAAYIYVLSRAGPRDIGETRLCDIALEGASIHVDFDEEGRVAGFEILGASRVLPDSLTR